MSFVTLAEMLPRSFDRSSSATLCASEPSRMICGRMKMISSVREVDLS